MNKDDRKMKIGFSIHDDHTNVKIWKWIPRWMNVSRVVTVKQPRQMYV